MALPTSYLTSTKNVPAMLDAIRAGEAPEKFTTRFLESLGFANTNDRLFINMLQRLGFLSGDRTPTDRYFRYLDQTQSKAVMAEGLRDAYADLFRINKTANKMSKSDIINKMKTLSQGQLSATVLDKMATTFLELSKHADFDAKPAAEEEHADIKPPEQKDGVTPPTPLATPAHAGKLTFGGLHYNIQIILPATRDPGIYDALFRSLKEHLL
jgi:hypothetical protein